MQVLSRGIAGAIALLLVGGGVLTTHHEATTRHVRDSAAVFAHTAELTSHHTGHSSDIHGQRTPGAPVGDCALLTAFHQPVSAAIATPVVVAARRARHHEHPLCTSSAAAASAVYRVAPKTSPPTV